MYVCGPVKKSEMKKAIILFLALIWMICPHIEAQTSVNMGSQNSITGCNINIYDDGGSTGSYGPSHNYTLTIYPSANQGRVSIEVVSLDVHADDTLFIYDGIAATGSPIATLNNNTYNAAVDNGTFMASQYNTSGALTLRFKTSNFLTSSGNNHGEGFQLHATCVTTCSFQLALDTVQCSHLPQLNPDGYYYLDLCPNEAVHLAVKGIYNNQEVVGYTQSDATTTFYWQLEPDLIISGIGMDSLTHVFPAGRGFDVRVSAHDTLSCPVQQPIAFRVRMSDSPIQTIQNLPQLCIGQTVTPTVGTDLNNQFIMSSVGYALPVSLTVSDTVFLPDGENCPPYGLYYRSEITFTDFPNDAVLTSENDILYVRIKMEHSAIEDLQIHIFCPNGSSCTILPYPNYNVAVNGGYESGMVRVNLGSAYRPDGGSCNEALNPIGEPWNYIWSNNSTLGYSYASGNGMVYDTNNFHSHYNPHWDYSNYYYFEDTYHSYSVDSTNVAQMTQVYHPYQSFSSLVGCPLNGNWYIQVQDMLQEDNGYIVEWELALNSQLMPSGWDYYMEIDSFYFTGNNVVNGTTLQPESSGDQTYSMTLIDNFGCEYDTSFHIMVHEWPEVNLGEDIFVCPGTSVYLHPTPSNSTYQYTWNTGSTASGFYTSEPGTYTVTASLIIDSLTCSSSDTVELHNFVVSDTTFLWDTICQGYDYENYGFSISAEFLSQELDQLPNSSQDEFTGIQTAEDQNGCDSLVILHLVVFRHWQKEQTILTCEQYIWDGDTLTESGDYVKNFVSQDGCDSTVTLHLNIDHPSENEIWETSCGSYFWNNATIYESGDYTNTFTSIGDCDSIVTLHLTIVDTFLASYNSNPDFCSTKETVLSVEGNFDTYVWNTGDITPFITVTESGNYSVTASNYACERTARFQIPLCVANFWLPNAITPSKGDALNDSFALSDYDKNQISEFKITIYDRWGNLVFTSNDKNFVWDGTIKGELSANSVYSYIIHYTDHNGKAHTVTGTVTVL